MNKVVLIGRLTANPELKKTQTGTSVASFTLAVDRRFKKDGEQTTDFINIVAWKTTAEFICKYFTKGKTLGVAGSIQTRSWQAPDGTKRFATEVMADEAYFVGDKIEKTTESNALPTPDFAFTESADDGQLPF